MNIKTRQFAITLLLCSLASPNVAAAKLSPQASTGQSTGFNVSGNGQQTNPSQLGSLSVLNSQANGNSTTGSFTQQNRQGLLLPGETDVRKLLPQSEDGLPPPYGANLFAGGYETERSDGVNDNYLIAPGDKLNIWIWGAVNFSNVVTVDNQGNIFIPEI